MISLTKNFILIVENIIMDSYLFAYFVIKILQNQINESEWYY